MSTTRSQPSEWDWLEQKNFIGYEYLIKDTSLKDLVVLLRAQGLHTTKGQLEYKLRTWNISKNLDKKTWQYVERKISQRKQKGKESDVIHCGRRLQKLKITKETNRHRDTNITARFKTRYSPISIESTTQHLYSTVIPDELRVALLSPVAPSARNLLEYNVMPEWYPGEHTKTAQNLFAGPTTESLSEYFKVMVYMLSNSMVTQYHSQLDFYTSLIGIIDLRADLKKLRNESSTFRAFFESLFQFEIREATSRFKHNTERPRPLHLITWLLELGQDPNCHCQVVLYNTLVLATPIQQATIAGNLELVELLLRFHACADIPQSRTHKEAFVNLALESGCSDVTKLRVLNLLFDHKFLNMDEMLRAAIELRDEALMCKMLQCGADATSYETSWLHPRLRRGQYAFFRQTHFENPSALMMAVQTGGRMADLMLDYLLLKGHPAPSILADAYIAAAYGGHYAIVLRLDELNSFGKVCNAEGITPLQAAVVGGNATVCRYLLERYKGASSLLVLVAAVLVNIDVLQLLIDYGANPNARLCTDHIGLCESIDVGNHDVTQYLVEAGADVNEFDIHAPFFNTDNPISPLQLAAKEGDIDIALYLLEKGAKLNAPPAFYQGATALQFASIGGYLGFARHLLQLGARINVRGSGRLGRSALEGAAEHGRLDMLALLVHHGAVTGGSGRQQLINSVAYAQGRAHNTAAEWLKDSCGWTDADQHLLELVDVNAWYPLGACLRRYCCDEYHDSDTDCVYHYTEEQRSNHYKYCQKCLELDAESGKGHDTDDGNEGSVSSEDGDTDSEGDEN
ncbi:Ankyrin-3 [Fusarium oxysporum f. sp. cubense]|uniref:Ankyrin-3 n=1 Tax=Fusarium oxysporum f. sp. cubense TaxID=61366 RepID=A0A559LHK5_FUSOC|nr:Ankyrin-3 [Fusarium oxysporum f. sp. cubense]